MGMAMMSAQPECVPTKRIGSIGDNCHQLRATLAEALAQFQQENCEERRPRNEEREKVGVAKSWGLTGELAEKVSRRDAKSQREHSGYLIRLDNLER
jgi:hypothetical protein